MTILDTIVQSKRLQFPQSGVELLAPLNSKEKKEAQETTNKLKTNLFARSLRRNEISIIGEIKPRSPSAGKLLEPSRLPEILGLYKQHCAAISVLTDEQFFSGSFDLLTQVKQATGLPVLCKDFIVSTEQILLAKKHGADAILLIAKILKADELAAIVDSAINEGLCPVVEINNLFDLQAIAELPVEVVLINNRNLDTMQIDLDTTSHLASYLNKDQIIISASGIKTKEDIQRLLPSSRRFLIGTSLMQSADPEALLRELTSSNLRSHTLDAVIMEGQPAIVPAIKICGITNSADANMALEAGADFIGLIFAPRSKRLISIEEARAVVDSVKEGAKIVGVFQNQDIEEVNRIAEELNLDFIQLHGEEDPTYVSACVRPVIKVFEYSSSKSVDHRRLLEFAGAGYFLFDLDKNSPAETTESIDRFSALAKSLNPIRDRIPPFFLAGKLSLDNVQQATQAVLPFAIDVASGVEKTLGKKSITLTKQFCNFAKSKPNTHAPQVVNK